MFAEVLSVAELPNINHNLLIPLQGCDAFSQSGLYSNHQDIGPRYAVSFYFNICQSSVLLLKESKRCQKTRNKVIDHPKY